MPRSNHQRVQYIRQLLLIFLLVMAIGLSASAQTSPSHHKHKSKKAEKPLPEEVAAPAPPPPPPTPEQMPPKAPTVDYQNGQLSIVAPNSTLGDILQAVKKKTGASIDVPAGANERVVSRFGPGPARDVLAALLNGTHFNYVMIGSDANPTSVAQVILTPRVGGETAPSTQANGQMLSQGVPQYAGQPMRPQSFPGAQAVDQAPPATAEDTPSADNTEEDDNAAQQQDNPNPGDEGAPEQANQGNEGQENGQPQVKTPEQLLQELQRQQQIQQQQQQQQQQMQPSPAPASPPQ